MNINQLIQHGSPFELQYEIIEGIGCKIFTHSPKSLQDVFFKAVFFKQNEFIVNDYRRLNFRMLISKAIQLADVFRKQYGVAKGDRIAILMENRPEWVIAFISIYFAGATAVILHADSFTETIEKCTEITDCLFIITDSDNSVKLKFNNVRYPVILIFNNPGDFHDKWCVRKHDTNISFINLYQVPDNESVCSNYEIPKSAPDDEALISFTSGTTGPPKGIVFSHRNMTTGLMNMMLGGYMMGYREQKNKNKRHGNPSNTRPCSLLLSPLSHIGGYSQIMLMCYLGGKIVLMNDWNTHKAAALIKKEKIRSLCGATPEMIRELLRTPGLETDLATLKNINIYGEAPNQSFLREIVSGYPCINIGTGYGMTETCGAISSIPGMELIKNPNCAGTILPSVDVKVIDESGHQKKENSLGEVCIRGAMVMRGYIYNLNNSALKVEDDGWLKTGDLGYLDKDRNLYIIDRIKNLLICGNSRVSAGEMERIACEHSMVDEAVVLGMPSQKKCKTILMIVIPKENQLLEEINLKKELSSRLINYSKSIKIVLVNSLPRTASGKVNRSELRRKLLL